jgi:hypothetical protein
MIEDPVRRAAPRSSSNSTAGLMLTRYTDEGKLDKSFGDGGTVAIDPPKS